LARLGLDVEGRREQAARLGPAHQVVYLLVPGLEEGLADPGEPPVAAWPRLERVPDVVPARSRTRQESEGGIERIAEFHAACVGLPEIVREIDLEPPAVPLSRRQIAARARRPSTDRQLLVPVDRRAVPVGVQAGERVGPQALGVAMRANRADAEAVTDVVGDAAGRQVGTRDAVRRAGLDVESPDA